MSNQVEEIARTTSQKAKHTTRVPKARQKQLGVAKVLLHTKLRAQRTKDTRSSDTLPSFQKLIVK